MDNNEADFDELIKLIIIGDTYVGKTNYLHRFVEGNFNTVYEATVGFDFKSKICKLPKCQKVVKFQMWDTAGTEKYMAINQSLFQKVQGIILMYDITQIKTFNNLEKWMAKIKEIASGIPLILIGNKIDLENERKVSKEKGEEFANKYKILFFESSGKNGVNVEESFFALGEEIIKSNISISKHASENIISIDTTPANKTKKICC